MRILAALLLASTLHAADWISLRDVGVELVSDASERNVRQALDQLAQIRSLLPPSSEPEPVPLRIFLFAKESEYRAYAPNGKASGFYQSGLERDYIALHAGTAMPRVVKHEYVHFALRQRNAARPTWLEEGLAEYYSNFDGKRVGLAIPEHVQMLQRRPWLSAEEMNAPRELGEMFYAQSWALVHMLRREAQFPELVTERMLADLRPYLRVLRPTAVDVPSAAAPVVAAESVSPLNALLLRADLALRSQHLQLAGKLYQQAASEYPNSSAAATGLGTLAFANGDREAALAHLKHSLALNDRDGLAWFQLALIENDSTALEKAALFNPNLAEAHVLLGVRATDDGNLDAALAHLEQATRLLPRKSYPWYSLGFAQQKRGDIAGARTSLERALRTATTAEQRKMAETLLDSLGQI